MKNFIYWVLIVSFLNGNTLDEKIENLVGSNNFIKHRNLIISLTRDESAFYIGENIKYTKVLDILNQNGLLKLRYDSPKKVEITFIVENLSMKAMKILKDTLSNLGYTYYFTDHLNFEDKTMTWQINFKSEYMLDPYIFNKELNKNEAKIIDIEKVSPTNWRYTIDISNVKLVNAIKIEKNEKVTLSKPLKPYLIRVNDAKQLSIMSRKLNHWHPKISFFDKNLNVLNVFKKDMTYKGLRINIPLNTYYIKIEDNYALLNIKRGLTIIVR